MSEYAAHKDGNSRSPSTTIFPIVLSARAVVVQTDGSLKLEEDQPRESKYDEIAQQLNSPDLQPGTVYRQILSQIALVISEMSAHANDPNATRRGKNYLAEIRALQVLHKQVEWADKLAHRDVLDFDGPKFQYVLEQYADYFKQAAEKTLGKSGQWMVPQIMKQLCDILAKNDEKLRRNTKKIR